MTNNPSTFGRTELAQLYFPRLCPEAAWHKLRSWLKINLDKTEHVHPVETFKSVQFWS